jgi:hypothetical protein
MAGTKCRLLSFSCHRYRFTVDNQVAPAGRRQTETEHYPS